MENDKDYESLGSHHCAQTEDLEEQIAAWREKVNELQREHALEIIQKSEEIARMREALERIKLESRIAGRVYINNMATVALAPHLCDSCALDFPTCVSGEIAFGIEFDSALTNTRSADKVVACEGYALKKTEPGGEVRAAE